MSFPLDDKFKKEVDQATTNYPTNYNKNDNAPLCT